MTNCSERLFILGIFYRERKKNWERRRLKLLHKNSVGVTVRISIFSSHITLYQNFLTKLLLYFLIITFLLIPYDWCQEVKIIYRRAHDTLRTKKTVMDLSCMRNLLSLIFDYLYNLLLLVSKVFTDLIWCKMCQVWIWCYMCVPPHLFSSSFIDTVETTNLFFEIYISK